MIAPPLWPGLARPGAAGIATAPVAALLAFAAAASGWAPGVACGDPRLLLVPCVAGLGLALAVVGGPVPRRPRAAAALAGLAFAAAFLAHGAAAGARGERALLPTELMRRGWIVARVRGLPTARAGDRRMCLEIERSNLGLAHGVGLDARVRGGPPLADGDLVRGLVALEAFDPARNPGGFDGREWARREGLAGRARLTPSTLCRLAGPAPGDLGARLLSPLRAHLLARIRAQERGRGGAFLAGFLLGDRSGLDAAAAEDLRRIGGLHLLAISGMHVVLVAALFERAIRMAGARGRRAAFLRLIAVTLYCALAGGAPSVWRAGASAAWLEVAALLGRPLRGAQALALAVLTLVALQPANALDAGFQLSVFATWGLLAIASPIAAWARARAARAGPVICDAFVTTLAAQLVALPCLALVFGTISTLGLLANLVLVPVTNVALVAGLLALVSGAPPLWIVADAGALLTLRIAGALARTPAALAPLTPSFGAAATLAAVVAAWTLPGLARRLTPALPALAGVGGGALLVLLLPGPGPPGGALVVTAIDVGQGDGLLVVVPDGRAFVVDAGEARPGFDQGARSMLPALRRRGIVRLAAAVASHGDLDHAGGLPAILRDVPTAIVAGPSAVAETLLARASARGGAAGTPRAVSLTTGDVLLAGTGYEVHVLWPPPGFRRDPAWTPNRESVVLLASVWAPLDRIRRAPPDTIRVLLTGDIDTLVEARLLAAGLPRLDVLKVAHHGSHTSSAEEFIAATRPAVALASIGRANRFGHPHADVRARYAAHGIAWRATDIEGALDVVIDATGKPGRARIEVIPARGAYPFGLAAGCAGAVRCGSDDVAPHAPPRSPGIGPRFQLPRPRRRRGRRQSRRCARSPCLRSRRQRCGRAGPRARDRDRDSRTGAVPHATEPRGRARVDRTAPRARRRYHPPGRVHAHPARRISRRLPGPRAQPASVAPSRLSRDGVDPARARARGPRHRLHGAPGRRRHRRGPDSRPGGRAHPRRRHARVARRASPRRGARAVPRDGPPFPHRVIHARGPPRALGGGASMTLASAEAVLFDLGGTCLQIDHDFIAERVAARGPAPDAAWAPRGEQAGRRILETMLREGKSSDEQWRGFFEGMLEAAGAALADRDAIFAELVAFHRRHHLWRKVMPGIPETLRGLLARGYRVAAISNSDGRAEAILTTLGLAQEFEFVLDSRDLGVEKPDPRIFLDACARLDLPPGRCAYVGDVVAIDVEGARGAGLHPVLFDAYGAYDASTSGGAPRAAEPAQLLGLFPDRRHELSPRRSAPR